MSPPTTLIVGAGLAGARAAETLRANGYEGRVLLVGEEPVAPYERPALSKEFLAGKRDETSLLLRKTGILGGARDRADARTARPLRESAPPRRSDRPRRLSALRPARRRDGRATAPPAAGRAGGRARAAHARRRTRAPRGSRAGREPRRDRRRLRRRRSRVDCARSRSPRDDRRGGAGTRRACARRRGRAAPRRTLARARRRRTTRHRRRDDPLGCRRTRRLRRPHRRRGCSAPTRFSSASASSRPASFCRSGRRRTCIRAATSSVPDTGRLRRSTASLPRTAILGLPLPAPQPHYVWSDQFGLRLQVVGSPRPDDAFELDGGGDSFAVRYLDANGTVLAGLLANRPAEAAELRRRLADDAIPLAA